LVSFASKNVGVDMVANNCRSFELVALAIFSMCGAILLIMANIAGYTASSLPCPKLKSVYIDYDISVV
jgi:hypothetical protein